MPLRPVTGSPACPVTLLRELCSGLEGAERSDPLFSFPTARRGEFAFLSMPDARRLLSLFLQREGLGEEGYTFHSLRRGGCSLAFAQGADLADLQLLGGWRSRAIDAYFPHDLARERAARVLANGSRTATLP